MTHHNVPPLVSAEKKDERIRQTLLMHFRNLGSKLHSLSLLNMANAVAADPLEKVKGLITDLIKKVAEGKLKKVNIRLDKANAQLAELADQVTSLTEDIAEIQKANTEATEMRNEEKKAYEKNYADFKEAEAAVIE